ncbi:MAG: type I restriction enzyme HsdR N-terminal domain-containing protein [Fimbriimonadaceae bacterium]|nr:type I restriction enzyme HsdR N-terminal domain-containing protein [Fimbriimonadaceae bacterium]
MRDPVDIGDCFAVSYAKGRPRMPDLIDDIRAIAIRIEKTRDAVSTEEATKNAFIMPFITALGYDVFDPMEVTPELVADVGLKKGEKIDYAILRDGQPIMLFECKHHGTNLEAEHASQLFRYFACTPCRLAVLTNGIEYRFFTDLEAPNKMDSKPFLVFKVTDFPESLIPELKKLSKSAFDLDAVLSTANELKFMREIKSLLGQQMITPSDEFVKFCANGIGIARLTPALREQFTQLTRKAFAEFVSDRLSEKLKSALGASTSNVAFETKVAAEFVDSESKQDKSSDIVTTEEELEAFYIVKAILRDIVDVRRVNHRDQKSYFAILLDDNNRKPIARLHFNGQKQKYLGLFDELKNEERVPLGDVDDVYAHADRIRAAVLRYDQVKNP